MKKTQWVLGKHSIRGWNMALSCLKAANWSANMNLGVTMSRQRLQSDYFWAPPSPWILWDGFLQSENYSAAIKVSPPFGQIKGPGARWKTFERRKLSFAAKIPTKPVLGATDRFVKQPRQQRTNRVDEHYGHKSQWQQVVLYSIQIHRYFLFISKTKFSLGASALCQHH